MMDGRNDYMYYIKETYKEGRYPEGETSNPERELISGGVGRFRGEGFFGSRKADFGGQKC